MKALIAIFTWVMGLVNPSEVPVELRGPSSTIHKQTVVDGRGVHIVGTNPRTVVALEDTHFRPNN